jgi:small subunit ribosomal protein S8
MAIFGNSISVVFVSESLRVEEKFRVFENLHGNSMDHIANMLTKIRNAQMAGHTSVTLPSSKVKLSIARILERRGFVEQVTEEDLGKGIGKCLSIILRYHRVSPTKLDPAIRGLRRVSRGGQRQYVKREEIRKVKNGFGCAIVSTSKGVMTGAEAYHSGLGGEYICEVW